MGYDSSCAQPISTLALGVADGVGEWQWRFGLDPRAFADELMFGQPRVMGDDWWLLI